MNTWRKSETKNQSLSSNRSTERKPRVSNFLSRSNVSLLKEKKYQINRKEEIKEECKNMTILKLTKRRHNLSKDNLKESERNKPILANKTHNYRKSVDVPKISKPVRRINWYVTNSKEKDENSNDKKEIIVNNKYDYITWERPLKVPQSTRNKQVIFDFQPHEYSQEDLRSFVKESLKQNELNGRNVYYTAAENAANFSFEKDKSQLWIDPSIPFGELVHEDSLNDNPQSDNQFEGVHSEKWLKIDIPSEKEESKEMIQEVSSPKFGAKTIDFNTGSYHTARNNTSFRK